MATLLCPVKLATSVAVGSPATAAAGIGVAPKGRSREGNYIVVTRRHRRDSRVDVFLSKRRSGPTLKVPITFARVTDAADGNDHYSC